MFVSGALVDDGDDHGQVSSYYFRFRHVETNYSAIGMSIGEAHQTRSSYLQSANTNGAPTSPTTIVLAYGTEQDHFRLPYHLRLPRPLHHPPPPRLLTQESHIDWALLNGNGNTMNQRVRQYKKIKRHRSQRSETIIKHLPPPWPPCFSHLMILHFLENILC